MLDMMHMSKPIQFKVQHLCKASRLGTCFVKRMMFSCRIAGN